MNKPCPYAEIDRNCAKCVTCHAIDPPARAPNRRLCTRTRQWPGCTRYIAAWKIGVTPYREGYAVTQKEQTPPKKTGGIGGINMSFTRGLPTKVASTPEPPCRFLVFTEGSCKDCGGYVCAASDNRRIMDSMLEVCMKEPGECAIHEKESE